MDDQRVALTKRLLQEGLLRLIANKDIDSIRVSELCAEAGINRATFYRHYQQPRDILNDLRRRIIKDVTELARRDHAETKPEKWLEDICQYFLDHADLLRVLFITRTDDEFVTVINEAYANQLRHLRSMVGESPDDDTLKLMAYCYAGGFYYILRQWILEPIDKSPKDIAAIMYRFFSGNESTVRLR